MSAIQCVLLVISLAALFFAISVWVFLIQKEHAERVKRKQASRFDIESLLNPNGYFPRRYENCVKNGCPAYDHEQQTCGLSPNMSEDEKKQIPAYCSMSCRHAFLTQDEDEEETRETSDDELIGEQHWAEQGGDE